MVKHKLGYVSLFSSGGLGCYGFSLEGFDCIVTSELIKRRLEVQKVNKVCSIDTGYVDGDFTLEETKVKVISAIENWKQTYSQEEVEVIIATPPCQGISVANHKKNNELRRNSLVVESLTLINKVLPRYFILENVRGFLTTICTDTDGQDKKIADAILLNLGGSYNIAHDVINFKDYGNGSSRTRTLVVGVRKDLEEVTPYDIFPDHQKAPTLRELISDLPALPKMGDIAKNDLYHMFRPYNERMLPWIQDTKEGESAFDNSDPAKRPHALIDGKIVPNQNKNGDKYKRCRWDSVAPCVHTRNDILASQNTIHPEEPRVFSIRELMRFMSVPESFRWTDDSLGALNSMPPENKRLYLKKHEINIRQCLGEGVPTKVFQSIAQKIARQESKEILSISKIKRLIDNYELQSAPNLLSYLANNSASFVNSAKIAELANAKRLDDAAYYTRQDLCFNIVSGLPDFKNKKVLRILEPSVGVGNFLPSLFNKYKHKQKVNLDVIDISPESLEVLKRILKTIHVPANFDIRIINDDFLTHSFRNKYDLVVGNPPFGKLESSRFSSYLSSGLQTNIGSRNLFALFYEKSLKIASTVAFISPKSILSAPEFKLLRDQLSKNAIVKINDYGEKGFAGVKIETISMQIGVNIPPNMTAIESFILKDYRICQQSYVIDPQFPSWLIYRDSYFDALSKKLNLNIFTAYRDRSLTTKNMVRTGGIRVLKSRNIKNGYSESLDDDHYIESLDASPFAKKFYNHAGAVVAPNLSYYPRAAFLPKDTVVDGSAAILLPKTSKLPTLKQLEFFASKEFYIFYRIARNYATRSLNIDSSSVYFWGIPKDNNNYEAFEHKSRSQFLFARHHDLLEALKVEVSGTL